MKRRRRADRTTAKMRSWVLDHQDVVFRGVESGDAVVVAQTYLALGLVGWTFLEFLEALEDREVTRSVQS